MKFLLMLACLLSYIAANATNMRWDFVELVQYSDGRNGFASTLKPENDKLVGFSLYFSARISGKNKCSISDFNCNLATAITWTLMAADDIAGPSSFGDGMPSLFSSVYKGATGELSVDKDSLFYLAFQVFELIEDSEGISLGEAYYGWVGFHISRKAEVEIVSSAIDLDGGSVMVAGGSIPEPSATLLLLMGFSALILRRRVL